jgi:hypothetical protein
MQDERPTQGSTPAAEWLAHSRKAHAISSASPALLAPQTGFTYAALCWLVVGGAILPLAGTYWLPAPAPECQTAPLALKFGGETNATMSVASGMSCTLFARVGSASLNDVIIETPPQHGWLNPRGRSGIVYRAQSGYKGDDTFAIELRGRTSAESGAMKVRVNVSVR